MWSENCENFIYVAGRIHESLGDVCVYDNVHRVGVLGVQYLDAQLVICSFTLTAGCYRPEEHRSYVNELPV